MSMFWGLALLLSLLAVGFVVVPLLRRNEGAQPSPIQGREETVLDLFNQHLEALEQQRRQGDVDEAQYQQMKRELELSLLEDIPAPGQHTQKGGRWALYLVAMLLPLLAFGMYLYRGSIADVRIIDLRDQYFAARMQGGDERTIEPLLNELVGALTARLQVRPDNIANRYLLARTLMQQGQFGRAVVEYSRMVESEPEAAELIGELAQAVFLASDNRVTPQVEILVQRALHLDPQEITSLGLAGIIAFEQTRYQDSLSYWGQAVAQLGQDSPAAQSLLQGMSRARELLGQGVGVASSATSSPAAAETTTEAAADAAVEPSVTINVSLGASADIPPQTTVFVYARAWEGARMPLAISRLTLAQLPATVTLSKSMAMAPGMDITSVSQLEIVARVSFSGQPIPQSGDWEGKLGPVTLSELTGPLSIVISEQLP